ncbi:MAG: DUF885 domain-containing protein [Acidobacteria bacterium]|nr:DUF885 domain-containing protein [Acidobacteriota bacterium]
MKLALLALCLTAASTLVAQSQGAALHALFDREWDWQMQQNPAFASELGDRRWNDRWPDVSLSAIEMRHQHHVAVLQELKRIPSAALSPADQLNSDLFRKQLETDIEEHQFHWYLIPLNQRGGIQTSNELGDALRFTTVKDYEDWIARLNGFGGYMQQTIALMRQGIREHMLLPRIIMQRIPGQIGKQTVDDPAGSSYYKPFLRMPESFSPADRERLQRAGQQAIFAVVIPAFRTFHDFFVNEYLPACPEEVGIWKLPNGDAMYRFFVRRFTTTGMTPEQVHQVGLDEVKRIRAGMEKIREQVGFQGSLAEFFQYLRSDPKFFYHDPQELFRAYQVQAKTIDPNLVKVFRVLPRTPYGVEAIPAITAPDTTAAYYRQLAADGSRAGTYFVNLYKPESRPKWEITALTLHESVPGHHLQIALSYEQGELPKFRRYGSYDAFVEGWALYAESLGNDMGLYSDPYNKFGELAYDMWRAVRLVVDTGMHSMKWTRQQAIDFFMQNAPRAELDIVNEIDRYIAWPGQALGYKVGQLTIKDLRAQASRRLGANFDLKEFHEVVLRNGALPMDVLQRQVEEWIRGKCENVKCEM